VITRKYNTSCLLLQAFKFVRFIFQYVIEVTVFVFCYGRIFHTIRRQSKKVGGHAGRTQDVPMATTSRDPNTGQVQQQATGATTGNKLTRTEINVIKTMMVIVLSFVMLRTVPPVNNFLKIFGVSIIMFINITT